jgi:hypothetical protein
MENRTQEQLEKRRDEILKELNEVNEDLRIELDSDQEEQAIEIENQEVPIAYEKNLRKELAEIESELE